MNPSKNLYISSVTLLLIGFILGIIHVGQQLNLTNSRYIQDIISWDILSQWSIGLILLALYHFLLGIKVDRHITKNQSN